MRRGPSKITMPASDDQMIEFDCPLCSGAFEAPAELLGGEVECPHCGGVVELSAVPGEEPSEPATQPAEVVSPAPATIAQQETRRQPAETQPVERQPLTREQRAAQRRRLNLLLAVVGGVVLLIAFVVLANIPR